MSQRTATIAFVATLGTWLPAADADLWSYEHDGVVYFSNIPPSGKDGHRWSVVSRSGPGKAQTVSGVSGCDKSRADVVPSQDTSLERFHRYDRHIAEASTVYGLPEALIRAVIKVESDYDPRVISCAGAGAVQKYDGVPPYETTQQYVRMVLTEYQRERARIGGKK